MYYVVNDIHHKHNEREIMPLTVSCRRRLLILLDGEYQRLNGIHWANAPRNGKIPIGGGQWMDSFFRMEAIRGCQSALRSGASLQEAIKAGQKESRAAVKIWNARREYQVHRWEETAFDYLERLVYGKCD